MEVRPTVAREHPVEASRFLSILELGSTAAIADGIRGERHVVPLGVARALDRLRSGGVWETASAQHSPGLDSLRWLRFLLHHGYLHPQGAPVDHNLYALLSEVPQVSFPTTVPMGPKLKVLYLSHCGTDWLAENLAMAAHLRGMRVTVAYSVHSDRARIGEVEPDMVIVEPFDLGMSTRFWNRGARATDEERRALIETMQQYYAGVIDDLRPHASGRLILLRGITTPPLRPDGCAEFRRGVTLEGMAREVNELAARLLSREPNMMFMDEQHIVATHGTLKLISTSTTYGNLIGEVPDRSLPLSSRMCQEYLDAFIVWRATNRLKCVVVDLDDTMWPGVVGEGGGIPMEVETRPAAAQTLFGGIHQALGVLKDRGILLATCSRNNRDDVLAAWNAARDGSALEPFLYPEDFVLHEIGWDPKPVAMKRIMARLGLEPAHVVFVDDDPLQREEMRQAFPEMLILGETLERVRARLLTEPRLQVNIVTEAARRRTETSQGSIAREDAAREWAGVSHRDFLRTLKVELQVLRLCTSRHLPRVAELLKRTNQFNLTGLRLDARQLEERIGSDDAAIFALNVRDRFTDHGLVGVCLVRKNHIENVAISCRVIGLDVATPFLTAALDGFGLSRETLYGRLVPTDRNIPCRNLLSSVGFDEIDPGQYMRPSNRELPPPDMGIYEILLRDEVLEDARQEAMS